MLNITN